MCEIKVMLNRNRAILTFHGRARVGFRAPPPWCVDNKSRLIALLMKIIVLTVKKFILICAAMVAMSTATYAQGALGWEVVDRVVYHENDTLRVERLAMVNPCDQSPRYVQDWVNIANKTGDTLTVTYHVEATLMRYRKHFNYDFSLTVAPHDNMGDCVYSHFHKGHYIFSGEYQDTDCKIDKIQILQVR